MADNKQIDDWEDVPLDSGVDDWEDITDESTIGQRNLEKFGPADVSPSFLEQVMDTAIPAIAGTSQGLTAGFADEIGGAATAVAKDLGSLFGLSEAGDYTEERDTLRGAAEKSAEENPVAYHSAEIASALVGGPKVPGSMVAKGVTQGAAYGVGTAEEMEDVPEAALLGGALGGVGAKVAPVVAGKSAAALGKLKKGAEFIQPSQRAVRKAHAIKDEATSAAEAAKSEYLEKYLKRSVEKADAEEALALANADDAYKAAYKRLKDTGRYSEEALVKGAQKASDKVKETALKRARAKKVREELAIKNKAEDKYEAVYDKVYEAGKKSLEKPRSDLGVIKDFALGGAPLDSRVLGSAARLGSGASLARGLFDTIRGPLASVGIKSVKNFSALGEKAMRALEKAAKERGAAGTMSTHNMLLNTDENYRKAITKMQESD